ncbi:MULTISPECIES: AraC family transcriptional regulator [Photobacterium]|uniref:AraC family transcriptional regulator n=2 Tax=Photobacterium TaxID=657 RepID=A0A2T3HVX0_9GAMM|nr:MULTISPECIES: helix-turn-helix transcriptional regulator [Photobacterium]MCP4954397.1 helix-turn-helix transcriptional regulator [Photobacterium aquimaris]OBU20312.1 AraC family transcriptional regulator [Photobacterium aquimaris]PQJ41228.1 AraC family transcriptional regulator [Photobacterium aquimaris]PSU02874.1 AraC family transcriptional regulator [Photobacterium aquimaris]SMY33378.1 HTH-type transcriptional repressor of iron proteins A [Photobacterium andalusiense]
MNFKTSFMEFDTDLYPQKVLALRIAGVEKEEEVPFHQHHKGQLVMPLTGFAKCHINDAVWMVPAHCAVWIPSQVPHSNRISPDADVCMLFVEQDIIGMPNKACTLSISPLLRELIVRLAQEEQDYDKEGSVARLVDVLVDELISMPTEHFDFPIPAEHRLNQIAKRLLANPGDRNTVGEWATQFAMSERTLARLVKQEIGLTFGRWRGQLHIVVALQKLSMGESVQRVAEDLGYESVSAFILFFKKTLGRPPKQYMKERE